MDPPRPIFSLISYCLWFRAVNFFSSTKCDFSILFPFSFILACKSTNSLFKISFSCKSSLNATSSSQHTLICFLSTSSTATRVEATSPAFQDLHLTKCLATVYHGSPSFEPLFRSSSTMCYLTTKPMPQMLGFLYGGMPF